MSFLFRLLMMLDSWYQRLVAFVQQWLFSIVEVDSLADAIADNPVPTALLVAFVLSALALVLIVVYAEEPTRASAMKESVAALLAQVPAGKPLSDSCKNMAAMAQLLQQTAMLSRTWHCLVGKLSAIALSHPDDDDKQRLFEAAGDVCAEWTYVEKQMLKTVNYSWYSIDYYRSETTLALRDMLEYTRQASIAGKSTITIDEIKAAKKRALWTKYALHCKISFKW